MRHFCVKFRGYISKINHCPRFSTSSHSLFASLQDRLSTEKSKRQKELCQIENENRTKLDELSSKQNINDKESKEKILSVIPMVNLECTKRQEYEVEMKCKIVKSSLVNFQDKLVLNVSRFLSELRENVTRATSEDLAQISKNLVQ